MAIQETKIDVSISTSELFPETFPYSVYRKDRNINGGGVMLLIHKDISHMPITELENNSESVWLKVFANKTSHFVASWYRPPDETLEKEEFDLLFREQLDKIRNKHKGNKPPSVHVLGDLNFRVLKELATELGPVFAHLFQQSNDTGEIPSEWSLANICTLFKNCMQLSPNFLDLHTLQATRTYCMFKYHGPS